MGHSMDSGKATMRPVVFRRAIARTSPQSQVAPGEHAHLQLGNRGITPSATRCTITIQLSTDASDSDKVSISRTNVFKMNLMQNDFFYKCLFVTVYKKCKYTFFQQ